METTKTVDELKAVALTEHEARYLTDLARAAKNYREALETLQTAAQRDLDKLAAGNHTAGIGGQWLQEASSYHGALRTLLEAAYYAYNMEDVQVWQELVQAAYTEQVSYFHPAS